MKTLLALVFLVFALSVSAASLETARYIVVVGADAPASDVVLGANFAAAMKAQSGITYTSALDTDVYDQLDEEELERKTIVIIDGENDEVRLIGRNTAAESYFRSQGLDVEVVEEPTREDLLLEEVPAPLPPINETIIPDVPAPAIIDTEVEVEEEPEVEVIEEPQEPQETPQQTPRADEPNVIKRFWKWFSGLF